MRLKRSLLGRICLKVHVVRTIKNIEKLKKSSFLSEDIVFYDVFIRYLNKDFAKSYHKLSTNSLFFTNQLQIQGNLGILAFCCMMHERDLMEITLS